MRYFLLSSAAFALITASTASGRAEISINPYPLGAPRPASEEVAQRVSSKPANVRSTVYNNESYRVSDSEWIAFKGASAREILGAWSSDEQVKMIWATPEDYPVPETLKMSGSYESAVESFLNAYKNMFARPVGDLYIDPADGSKTLVISTYQGN